MINLYYRSFLYEHFTLVTRVWGGLDASRVWGGLGNASRVWVGGAGQGRGGRRGAHRGRRRGRGRGDGGQSRGGQGRGERRRGRGRGRRARGRRGGSGTRTAATETRTAARGGDGDRSYTFRRGHFAKNNRYAGGGRSTTLFLLGFGWTRELVGREGVDRRPPSCRSYQSFL